MDAVRLSDIFAGIAYKQLVSVDLPGLTSHQHEINSNRVLRAFFGTGNRSRGPLHWSYFGDDHDPESEFGDIYSFYDAREGKPDRSSEWRMYYGSDFLSRAEPGDVLVLARSAAIGEGDSSPVYALVLQKDSSWWRAAALLFGIEQVQDKFSAVSHEALAAETVDLIQRQILQELGFEVSAAPAPDDEALVTKKFGYSFPSTREMSAFARAVTEIDESDPDAALVAWLSREESLFRALERVIVQRRLDEGFTSVDDFLTYSLSVQNRRKARMGNAFEHHLQTLFDQRNLKYALKPRTEGHNRPDFLFPNEQAYRDAAFPSTSLLMLGVKSTCKDRWRQILTEADRIRLKHLCTLQPGISSRQTDEMRVQRVQLVVPQSLFPTYTPTQQSWLLNVNAFIETVVETQRAL